MVNFGGHNEKGLVVRVISMYFLFFFSVFSEGKSTERGYFLGCKIFKEFFRVLDIPDIFGG